jgi:hypothetical protein
VKETFFVPITADKKNGVAASSITWTNIPPPRQHRRGPENVIHKGSSQTTFFQLSSFERMYKNGYEYVHRQNYFARYLR